jgi:hypothetical protein
MQDSGPWARLVSNQRPLACEASALPLSYAPPSAHSKVPRVTVAAERVMLVGEGDLSLLRRPSLERAWP